MVSPAGADGPNGVATPPAASQAANGSPPATSRSGTLDNLPHAAPPNANTSAPNANGTGPGQNPSQRPQATSNVAAPAHAIGGTGSDDADPAASRKPRDARLIHMVLANLGVRTYEDRVPLQLMDFAYRYTVGVLQDAIALGDMSTQGGSSKAHGPAGDGAASMGSLRLAISARLGQQFQPPLPKDFMLELAQERNRVALPRAERMYGLRLPPEQYCLTGTGWSLREEWESEGDEELEARLEQTLSREGDGAGDTLMGEAAEEDMAEFEEVMMGDG